MSLAWSALHADTFYTVTNRSSSMLPFITMVEMHEVTAAGLVRRCAVPAHPEPCTEIDMLCDRVGHHMLTVSRDKDKDSSDRSDDCVVAIWDVDTLAVSGSIMDPDDYKNLVCAIQPKGGLIAVGGLSDIKVLATRHTLPSLCFCHNAAFFPPLTRPKSDLQRQGQGVPHAAHRPQRRRWRQARRARGTVVAVGEAAAGVHLQGQQRQGLAPQLRQLVTRAE
jgi:hypothetical protein